MAMLRIKFRRSFVRHFGTPGQAVGDCPPTLDRTLFGDCMIYGVTSRDYLERAGDLLRRDDLASLFYAALEIRCGIEARMQEYLQVWEHVSRRKREGWKISELGKSIEIGLKTGDQIIRWAVHDRSSDDLLVCLYHTPVSKRLRKLGEALGNYLHSLKIYRGQDDAWWDSFRTVLHDSVTELRVANRGTLLGPPMMQVGTKKVEMRMDIPPSTDMEELRAKIFGRKVLVKVSYIDVLPEPLEEQAQAW